MRVLYLQLLMTKLTGLESMIVKRFNDIDERLMKLEEMQEKKRIKKVCTLIWCLSVMTLFHLLL